MIRGRRGAIVSFAAGTERLGTGKEALKLFLELFALELDNVLVDLVLERAPDIQRAALVRFIVIERHVTQLECFENLDVLLGYRRDVAHGVDNVDFGDDDECAGNPLSAQALTAERHVPNARLHRNSVKRNGAYARAAHHAAGLLTRGAGLKGALKTHVELFLQRRILIFEKFIEARRVQESRHARRTDNVQH